VAAVAVDLPCALVEGIAVVADGKETMRRVIGVKSARGFDGVAGLLRVLLPINWGRWQTDLAEPDDSEGVKHITACVELDAKDNEEMAFTHFDSLAFEFYIQCS
jgi:hypothetical protein